MKHEPLLQTELDPISFPFVFVTISGAHLYGFPSADSDYDVRGVYVLPLEKIVGLEQAQETINRTTHPEGVEVDMTLHDVGFFFDALASKKNGNFLEQIFSPLVLRTSAEHEQLKTIMSQDGAITSHYAHHYLGFSRNQWNLYNRDEPRRVKPLLYVYRTLLTGIHLMKTGSVLCDLNQLAGLYKLNYLPELIRQKVDGTEQATLSNDDVAFHMGEYTRLTELLRTAHEETHLPQAPTIRLKLHELLLQIRL